jgi:GH24 family phage-related lysozyme (muramidase)
MTQNAIRLIDLFRFYKQGLPHQMAAVAELEAAINKANPHILSRDQQWFKTWSQSGKQDENDLEPALNLIRQFEGSRLEAYLCPAGVWTIGYGHTGPNVKPGLKITQADAEALLLSDVERFARAVDTWIKVKLSNNQRCALISFTFNVGIGALQESTLRKRLNNGEDAVKVAMEELPRWNKGDGKILEGLVRRRKAEVDLFCRGVKPLTNDVKLTPDKPFSFKVTPHIAYGELALNEDARRFTKQHQCDTAIVLCNFLEKARAAFGNKPIVITSGYRPPKVNASVGGASRSEHLYDAPDTGAVDFYIEGVNIYDLQEWCKAHWPFSLGLGAPKGFLHIGIRPGRPKVQWVY